MEAIVMNLKSKSFPDLSLLAFGLASLNTNAQSISQGRWHSITNLFVLGIHIAAEIGRVRKTLGSG